MLIEQRQEAILKALSQYRFCSLHDLTQITGCSSSTVRRDLDQLERERLVMRLHGGAQLVENQAIRDTAFSERETVNSQEKNAIAALASHQFLKNDAVIFLDAGTTVAKMLPFISDYQHLTLVTNSIVTAAALSNSGNNVLVPPGRIKADTKAIVGADTLLYLKEWQFDIAFLGTNGISLTRGFTTPDRDEAIIKREIISSSSSKVVLADHTKFDQSAALSFAELKKGVHVVTDQLPSTYQNKLKAYLAVRS